jgi:hypothetical protein
MFEISDPTTQETHLGSSTKANLLILFRKIIVAIIILPVFLHGCEMWSLILREEHRMRMFEDRMLRRIFKPKRDEVTGGWRKLRNDELHNLYSSERIIRIIKSRRVRLTGHVAGLGRREKHVGYWWESQNK